MSVTQIGPAACRSYLVVCDRTHEALLIDALLEDVDATARRLDEGGIRLRLVIDTHTHADHLSGGAEVARRLGVPYALHASTACARATERVADGARLGVGDLTFEVLHTPGHTGDSISLRCGRDLFTGDFLFLAQEGAGRLDLPGGDAGAHWDSLRRLAALPDETRVLPGHDYHGLTDAPLGVERRRNPRFQDISREEYVAWQRAVAAPTPDWMLDVIAANLGTARAHAAHHGGGAGGGAAAADTGACAAPAAPAAAAPPPSSPAGCGACVSAATGRVPLLSPARAWERLTSGVGGSVVFLDVREPWEYARGHARGARLVPLGALARARNDLPADAAEVIVICKSGGRSAAAAELLIDGGRRRVFSVDGGTERWMAEGLPVDR